MLSLSLLALALLRQNPNDPYVLLPSTWQVTYFRKGDHKDAALLGPEGEEIRFPPYGSGVEPAADVRKREPKATFVSTFLGGRAVEAVLTADGSLTVSFGWRRPHEHASDAQVSYATKVKTARQAAAALGIVLTRLRAAERDPLYSQMPKRSPDAPAPRRSVPGEPFGSEIGLLEGYKLRGPTEDMLAVGRFVSSNGPTIEMLRALSTKGGSQPGEMPDRVGWNETASLIDGELNVRTDSKTGLRAWFDPPGASPHPTSVAIFASKAETPASAVATIFAALTYAPAKR